MRPQLFPGEGQLQKSFSQFCGKILSKLWQTTSERNLAQHFEQLTEQMNEQLAVPGRVK